MNNKIEDKICLVSGASQGIGRATAQGLAALGATVVLVGRDAVRTAAAVADIKENTGNNKVEHLIADLSDFDQIRALAAAFAARYERLDVLVNNAGGMKRRRIETPDNFEFTWKLNHLGYFLLTAELMDSLRKAKAARIVNVASDAHYRGHIDFEDLQSTRHYAMWKAYGQSKLANVMFTYALARRLEGTNITANCLHPGVVGTGFVANIGFLERIFAPLINLLLISAKEGAETSIYLASSSDVAGASGKFFDKCRSISSSTESYDQAVQERLWELSVAQTGANFGL